MPSLHDPTTSEQSAQSDLPAPLRSRLVGYNVPNLRAWAKLSPAVKRSLFGITGRHRELLDELARGRP